uniref:Atlastin-2-like n=1 Tax=Callorhinchus milii TaxID=7868 RepID=A0A4W3GH24_CALMI
MTQLCGPDKPYVSPGLMEESHQRARAAGLAEFGRSRKMGGEEVSARYRVQLEVDLEAEFQAWSRQNKRKNKLNAVRTPLALLGLVAAMHLLSGLCHLLSLGFVSSLCDLVSGITIVCLMVWGYGQYTGSHPHLVSAIDMLSEAMLEQVRR